MRQFLPFTIVAAVIFSASSATAGFIVNGGFESPAIDSSYVTRTVDSQGIPDWVVGGTGNGSGVDQIGTLWTGASGSVGDQSVDIDYAYTLSQAFATTIGQQYQLEFFYSHNPGSKSSSGSASIVGGGELFSTGVLTHDISNSHEDMEWLPYSGTFVANSDSSTLTFAGVFDNGVAGWAVDNVSVMAVPEPTSLAIFGIGAGVACIGGVRRRRGNRQENVLA